VPVALHCEDEKDSPTPDKKVYFFLFANDA
jgi:hypothetical protein